MKNNRVIQGSGKMNRDGRPELPPDQTSAKNWPVLDLGIYPDIKLQDWTLQVSGLVAKPQKISWGEFQKFPQVEDTSDFHCVTGWSKLGMKWKGVRFSDIAKHCQVQEKAKFVFMTASDGYSTNISLKEAMKDDVLIVYQVDDKPLPLKHGGPVRMITPQLWAWKGAKWISGIEFTEHNRRGYWEERGYSNSAIPWFNDRYTADELPDEEIG